MNISELEIGTKLELELKGNTNGKKGLVLVSEFEWFAGENEAVIAAPIFEGSIVPLHLGTVMDVYFIKKRENDYSLYKFNAAVIGREVSDNLQMLRIQLRGELENVQRRNYYRLNCSVQVQYRIVEEMNDELNEGIPYKKTFTNNISGGGISLMLEEKIEVGRILECEMEAGQDKIIKFFGKIIRYERSELEGKFRFEAGIAYIRINDNDREAVVRYIFEEQRKLRKKGLI